MHKNKISIQCLLVNIFQKKTNKFHNKLLFGIRFKKKWKKWKILRMNFTYQKFFNIKVNKEIY